MGKKISLNPVRVIKTTKESESFEGLKDRNDIHEQPVSPTSRLLREPGSNVYIISICGMKTLIDVEVLKANIVLHRDKYLRFSCLQVY